MRPLPPRLFVTGTDTGVGKSVVTAALAAACDGEVSALKPVASGVAPGAPGEDAVLLGRGAGHEPRSYRSFPAPLSPHRAAVLAGESLTLEEVLGWVRQQEGPHTLVEGVGGWRVPVAWDWSISDLACAWGAPVLVVAPNQLGVLNHVRLTVEAITLAGLPLWGVVLNDGVSVGDEASTHNLEDLAQLLPEVWIRRTGGLESLDHGTLQAAGRILMTA